MTGIDMKDIKFKSYKPDVKGSRQLCCKIEDVCKSKLQFIDDRYHLKNNTLDLKNPINNLFFMNQSKKLLSSTSKIIQQ